MLKLQIIGHIGNDAIMHQHGTDNVLNFSVAHTDKYKDGNGQLIQKTTWVSCSWWVDGRTTVGQYLKKGTLVWIEGIPEAKMWENKEGKKACGLGIRIYKLELLGGKRDDNNQSQAPTQRAPEPANEGYTPYVDNGDEPPF
jgi:single-strand DNA-binding protein